MHASWLSRVRHRAGKEGWWRTFGATARSVFHGYIYRRLDEILIVRDLTEAKKIQGPKILRLEPAKTSDLPALRDFARVHLGRTMEKKLEIYIRCGYNANLAVENGRIVGYIWWMDSSIGEERLHPALWRLGFQLAADDVLSWDFFLAPGHREGGQAWTFFAEHMESLRERGFRRVFGWVEVKNGPARILYRMFGFQDVVCRRFGLFFSTFLFSRGSLYIRNGRRSTTPFDFKRVFPRRSWRWGNMVGAGTG